MTIKHLQGKASYLPEADLFLVEESYKKAKKIHQGTFRKSGEPFIHHPLNVAIKLAELKLDAATLCAALLHDVLEDTDVTYSELKKDFGKEIADMVEGVSKLKKVNLKVEEKTDRERQQKIETLRKMFVAMSQDLRVVLIKLADRWHNMETLSALPKERQKQVAQETLEIYAPLAQRLGMGEVKGVLEDLAFPYAYQSEHKWLSNMVMPKYEEREKYAQKIAIKFAHELKTGGIKAKVHSRAKHFYSLYKKLQKYEMDWDKIYDLMALRIIVEDVKECYQVLGLIHKKWKPLPGRIKDYIAMPKPNGYQSLHTTVFCDEGEIVEFQIRTKDMHEKAEYGVAAHWYYSDKIRHKEFSYGTISSETDTKVPAKKYEWIQELAKWQENLKNPKEFLDSLKVDVFKNRIFVFTPQGDVIDLPEKASPIDFAYHIHSYIGDHIYGTKVNGKMVSLEYELQNGEIVEIITQKSIKPTLDWLKFVKTAKAKERIKSAVKKQKKTI